MALLAEKKTTVRYEANIIKDIVKNISICFSSATAVSPQSESPLEEGEVVEVESEAVHQPVSAPPPALQAPQSFNFQQPSVFFTLSQESSRRNQIAASSG